MVWKAKPIPRLTPQQQDRFWSKVDKSSGPESCWPWTSGSCCNGYGRFFLRDGPRKWSFRSHRIAMFLTSGDVPTDLVVCHKCDNRLCCNPAHLFVGSHMENEHDKIRKGRSLSGGLHPKAKHSDATVRNAVKVSRVAGVAGAAKMFGINVRTLKDWISGSTRAAAEAARGEGSNG